MRRYVFLSLVLGVTLGIPTLLGCQQGTESTPLSTGASSTDTASTTNPGEHEITLEVKSWEEMQAWVKTQSGKVVVIDGWSTSCPPCLEEFPHFIELQNKFPTEVACASFSLDYMGRDHNPPAALREQIHTILKDKLHATTYNFLSSDSDEEATEAMEIAAIPVAFVYDQQGTLVKKFTNDDGEYGKDGYTYQKDIIPFVEKLVRGEK